MLFDLKIFSNKFIKNMMYIFFCSFFLNISYSSTYSHCTSGHCKEHFDSQKSLSHHIKTMHCPKYRLINGKICKLFVFLGSLILIQMNLLFREKWSDYCSSGRQSVMSSFRLQHDSTECTQPHSPSH